MNTDKHRSELAETPDKTCLASLSGQTRTRFVLCGWLMIASYCGILICAGHGCGPIGAILVLGMGQPGIWLTPFILSWIGIVLTFAATLLPPTTLATIAGAGGLCIQASSLIMFVVIGDHSMGMAFTAATAIPFFVVASFFVAHLVRLARNERNRRNHAC